MSERMITVKIDCEDKACGKCEHREHRTGYVSNHDCLIYGAWAEWDGVTRLEECIKAEQGREPSFDQELCDLLSEQSEVKSIIALIGPDEVINQNTYESRLKVVTEKIEALKAEHKGGE